ncbi:hypothetical protein [Herbidospora sp. RD11066]
MVAARALACVGLMWTCLAAAAPTTHDVADTFVTGERSTVSDPPAVEPDRPVSDDLPFTGAPLEALGVAVSGLALTGVLLFVGERRRRRHVVGRPS